MRHLLVCPLPVKYVFHGLAASTLAYNSFNKVNIKASWVKYFFLLWLLFLVWFSLIFVVLFRAASLETYSDLGVIGYFIFTFRVSAGDFELEPLTE